MKMLIAIGLLSLSGCASMSTEMRYEEAGWQVLNVAAVATNDQRTAKTYTTAAVLGMGHFAVSRALSDMDAPRWVQRSWQVLTIGATGFSISRNFGGRPSPEYRSADDRTTTQPVDCKTMSCL